MNADLHEGQCVCRPSWTHDPDDPTSPCICPDLCLTKSCPSEGSCRQVTCHLAICTCPDNLAYSASNSSCISKCRVTFHLYYSSSFTYITRCTVAGGEEFSSLLPLIFYIIITEWMGRSLSPLLRLILYMHCSFH